MLHLGVGQGIRSILVATALATVALGVDTALAIPALLVLPFGVAAIVLVDRVLEVRDGTVIEWERRTADALLH